MSDITIMLRAVARGEKQAGEDLLPLIYEDLRRLAAARMASQAPGHTLQPTALVHEAWLRLASDGEQVWDNRAHFFGAAAVVMRQILIASARRKSRLKHGGGQERLSLENLELAETTPDEKVLLVDEALAQLEQLYPERGRVVALKFFAGLTNEEAAEVLGISEKTVRRHWNCARLWLLRRIQTCN